MSFDEEWRQVRGTRRTGMRTVITRTGMRTVITRTGMRTVVTRTGTAVAAVIVLAGCSNGGAEPEEPKGKAAAEVCGGFAREAATTAALKAVTGADRFGEGLSDRDKALTGLRDAVRSGQENPNRPQGYTYCRLRPAGQEEQDVQVVVNGVDEAPGRDERLAHTTTWFTTGEQAFATAGHAEVFFLCRPEPPAKGTVIATDARAFPGSEKGDLRRRSQLITLANAAARQVSKDLGCADDRLAPGVPAPVPASPGTS
ncbi:hypothetical protein ACIRQF_34545 [Streptomyces sp. NPDC101191]|uniref:hypothetical protein n=1 Tax=Streptomyces sp. NPDC101191 TaxID=3366126 RepID=UPI0037F2A7FD